MNIGERIKEIRLKNGITQKELAKRLGIATNSLSRYEIGERIPSLEMVDKIAVALGVEPWVFVNYSATEDQLEQLKRLVDAEEMRKRIVENDMKDIVEKYLSLNTKGKEKANGYITALAETKEYTVHDSALQETEGNNE